MTDTIAITHALLSVSDKTHIVEFAHGLAEQGITLLSTGGTAALLKLNNIPVTDIADYTQFPEMMAGRVKTLHPKIYAGLLARLPIDDSVLKQHQIPRLGLVVVNLYPFEETVANPDCRFDEAIENIDIGGPSLLRAAAKNYNATTAIVDQEDYDSVLQEIRATKGTSIKTRFKLARKAFAHVAQYDAAISNYFSSLETFDSLKRNEFPETLTLQFQKIEDLRYGENPHQKAAFYCIEEQAISLGISHATQHQGKPLSYNNINDADAAIECALQFTEPACVIVKHANPCAVALAQDQVKAYEQAYAADSTSAFGGIIAFNETIQAQSIQQIINNQFVEVLIAPAITAEALQIASQKPNIRILTVAKDEASSAPHRMLDYKSVSGGLLVQERDNQPTPPEFEQVSLRAPTEEERANLLFAWQVVRFVKSNGVVYAKNLQTVGIGAGQMSRVFSSIIAEHKARAAGYSLQGAVLASDAFFPFKDSIEQAAAAGITAIIQPGGSVRDEEVIQAANEYNIAMIFTHRRHFRH